MCLQLCAVPDPKTRGGASLKMVAMRVQLLYARSGTSVTFQVLTPCGIHRHTQQFERPFVEVIPTPGVFSNEVEAFKVDGRRVVLAASEESRLTWLSVGGIEADLADSWLSPLSAGPESHNGLFDPLSVALILSFVPGILHPRPQHTSRWRPLHSFLATFTCDL
jgi:hypothetical protein